MKDQSKIGVTFLRLQTALACEFTVDDKRPGTEAMLLPHPLLASDPFLAGFIVEVAAAQWHLFHHQWMGIQGDILGTVYFA